MYLSYFLKSDNIIRVYPFVCDSRGVVGPVIIRTTFGDSNYFQWKPFKNPPFTARTCPALNGRWEKLTAGEHSGAFNSWRARYFLQDVVETFIR